MQLTVVQNSRFNGQVFFSNISKSMMDLDLNFDPFAFLYSKEDEQFTS